MTDSNAPNGGAVEPLPVVRLEDLPPRIRAAAVRAGWPSLMPVQARAIPYVLEERDVMVQSRTGSGKTGAFVLPIIQRINPAVAATQALILVPTRELAVQVHSETKMLSTDSGIRTVAVYGGVSYGPQLDAFRAGAHIVVGTPGRILDHLMRGGLTLAKLDILVFDEADRLMSMGFYPDMKRLRTFLPKHEVNGYMFSATYPAGVMQLARQFMYEPEFLCLSHDTVHVAEVEHLFYAVPAMQKDRALVRIVEIENPESAIVFCNTKKNVDYVTTILQRFGYNADKITSDLSQAHRERVLKRLHGRQVRFLVATDVAARGIDVPDLSHVIQYEPPEDPESYIHRAGRTGRAGAAGVAITLAAGIEEAAVKKIARQYKIDMEERMVPSDEDLASVVSQRLTAHLESSFRNRDKLQVERLQRFLPLAKQLMESEDEQRLIAMLLDDLYHREFHGRGPTESGGEAAPPADEPAEGGDPVANAKPKPRPKDGGRRRRR